MSAIGKGDWVEYVSGDNLPKGTVSQCIGFAHPSGCFKCGDAGHGLLLSAPLDNGLNGWCVCGWRPIYRNTTDFRELLTTPADQRERVDA